jgi:hypothetical protein
LGWFREDTLMVVKRRKLGYFETTAYKQRIANLAKANRARLTGRAQCTARIPVQRQVHADRAPPIVKPPEPREIPEVSDDEFRKVVSRRRGLLSNEVMDQRFDFAFSHTKWTDLRAFTESHLRVFGDEIPHQFAVSTLGGERRYLYGRAKWLWRGERERVTIFGVIGADFRSELRFAYGEVDGPVYLRELVLPFVEEADAELGRLGYVFYHDGVLVHTAWETVKVLELLMHLMRGWPPWSSDLNPIEPFLSLTLKRVLQRRPRWREEFEAMAREEWEKVATLERVSEAAEQFLPRLELVRQLGGGDSLPYSDGYRLRDVEVRLLRRVHQPEVVIDRELDERLRALTNDGDRRWTWIGRLTGLGRERVKNRIAFLTAWSFFYAHRA